jgi:hypothetical protein
LTGIAKGEPWGEPWSEAPDIEIWGADCNLATYARDNPGGTVRFHPDPDSDLARAVGLRPDAEGNAGRLPGPPGGITRVPVDALELGDGYLAVNAVIIGTAPDRVDWRTHAESLRVVVDGRPVFDGKATTVLIANGEFVNGADAVPRGHPGDGRIEIQIYSMRRDRRRVMRLRLRQGTHVPHPDITQAVGRHVEVHVSPRSLPLVCDGETRGEVSNVTVSVRPDAFHLLV